MDDGISPVQIGTAMLHLHNELRGYQLDGPQHALTMALADLVEWADAQEPRCDFDAALAHAREVVADCRQ